MYLSVHTYMYMYDYVCMTNVLLATFVDMCLCLFPWQCLQYGINRFHTLNEFCVICDKKHVIESGLIKVCHLALKYMYYASIPSQSSYKWLGKYVAFFYSKFTQRWCMAKLWCYLAPSHRVHDDTCTPCVLYMRHVCIGCLAPVHVIMYCTMSNMHDTCFPSAPCSRVCVQGSCVCLPSRCWE